MRLGWLMPALAVFLAAPAAHSSDYLYAWAMETRDPSTAMPPAKSMGRDFLAVFNIAPGSADFGRLVAMLPVGTQAQLAHHTNYDMPADGRVFASDSLAGEAYIFDLRNPAHPRLTSGFGGIGPYTHPHSFERLANGHTLVTYPFRGPADGSAGALVEVDGHGFPVKMSDAADPSIDQAIRPSSIQAVPALDRVVTTSGDMMSGAVQSSDVVQVWRLSDLKLLKTVALPKAPHYQDIAGTHANEARVLADGQTVLIVTAHCRLYKLSDLKGTDPSAQYVHDFGYRACAVPTVVGHYWVQTAMSGHRILSLDVSDPLHPVEVGHLALKGDAQPHWIAHEPGGNRLVITGHGWLATHALFATIDSNTGALALDPRQIDFDRDWPDGWRGPAMPHGALFSPDSAGTRDRKSR